MSAVSIKIVRHEGKVLTDAVLRTELTPMALIQAERDWGPFRLNAAQNLHQAGRVPEIPRHWHWDWGEKSRNLALLAYRCFGIECDQQMQGLLMAIVAGKEARLNPDAGKPLVYVEYLESAPWNVVPFVDAPRFGGIGAVLMAAAVELSFDEGFHGRVGLHSLAQAEGFYRNKFGMQGCGPDQEYQNLPYYELTRDMAQRIRSNSNAGVV